MQRLQQSGIALVLLLALATAEMGASTARGEYEVKATFLLNFLHFVRWPEDAFSGPSDPLVIGIFGDDPFDGELQEMAKAVAGSRPVTVLVLHEPSEVTGCDLVFIPASRRKSVNGILRAIGHAPVLVIGESDGFAEQGGMINFVVHQNHIRFEINPSAASASGLRISSSLLKLAIVVGQESA